MPIEVTCPTCQQSFNAPDNAAGKRAFCPQCKGVIEIPTPIRAEEVLDLEEAIPAVPIGAFSEPISAAPSDDERKPCPMCGEMIQRAAIKCRFCGEIFDEALAKAQRARGAGAVFGESATETQQRLLNEKSDGNTSILLFVLSLIGCFSPILAIVGIVFLSRRPYQFRYKGLAIAGTIIHCVWALIWIASIVSRVNR